MSRDFAKEIADGENNLSLANSKLLEARREFANVSSEHLKDWVMRQIEIECKKEPERMLSLGQARMGELKRDATKLQEDMPAFAIEALKEDSKCWTGHRYGEPLDVKTSLTDAILRVTFRIEPILTKYSFKSPNTSFVSQHGLNNPYRFEWSQAMTSKIDQYRKLQQEADRLYYLVENLKSEKAKSEAADLWSQS